MVFVADEIPPELRRVVEFLNEQMDPAEVLAVEVKQYVGQGMKTLVPRVIGQTAAAQQRRASGTSRAPTIDRSEFLADLAARGRQADEVAVRGSWSGPMRMGMEPDFLRTQTGCSFIPTLRHGGGKYYPISLRTSGYLILQMRFLVHKAPFDTPRRGRRDSSGG